MVRRVGGSFSRILAERNVFWCKFSFFQTVRGTFCCCGVGTDVKFRDEVRSGGHPWESDFARVEVRSISAWETSQPVRFENIRAFLKPHNELSQGIEGFFFRFFWVSGGGLFRPETERDVEAEYDVDWPGREGSPGVGNWPSIEIRCDGIRLERATHRSGCLPPVLPKKFTLDGQLLCYGSSWPIKLEILYRSSLFCTRYGVFYIIAEVGALHLQPLTCR